MNERASSATTRWPVITIYPAHFLLIDVDFQLKCDGIKGRNGSFIVLVCRTTQLLDLVFLFCYANFRNLIYCNLQRVQNVLERFEKSL